MPKLKLSKNSLQQQQQQLKLYRRLLPSLDLKRRQLTVEAQKARAEHKAALSAAESLEARIGRELPMLADENLDFGGLVEMQGYRVGEQNVVGTRLPILEHVEFAVADYSRLATPAWVDILVRRLKDAAEARVRARIGGQRVRTLDQAVRRITQRVNLFEKILIPTAKKNIQRIRISLGDAERAAVVTSKLAKAKQEQAGDPDPQGGRAASQCGAVAPA
jgi:V/A-type H+-transporting ATPase subunit D